MHKIHQKNHQTRQVHGKSKQNETKRGFNHEIRSKSVIGRYHVISIPQRVVLKPKRRKIRNQGNSEGMGLCCALKD